jgi:thiol-disulfide isomerase/thioredoxin
MIHSAFSSYVTALFIAIVASCSAFAQSTTISGLLNGADGKPISVSHVHLLNTDTRSAKSEQFNVNSDGTFSLSVPNGVYQLTFSGVNHSMSNERIQLYCNGNRISLVAQLKANTVPKDISGVTVITDQDNYSFGNAKEMTKQTDGTYKIEIPASTNTLGYQVIIKSKSDEDEIHSINGTMADSYVYDGAGDYRSIVNVMGGKAVIIFDPRKLPSESKPFKITFEDEASRAVQNAKQDNDSTSQMAIRYIMSKRASKPSTMSIPDLRKSLLDKIAKENNSFAKQLRLVAFAGINNYLSDSTWLDKPTAEMIEKEVPANSIAWYASPESISAIDKVGSGNLSTRILSENTSHSVCSAILFSRISAISANKEMAKKEKDNAIRPIYKELINKYPDTYTATRAKNEFNPDRAIQDGNPVPQFKFVDIDKPSSFITTNDLKGKWVLIDNWATWCGPCVMEMPALHTAYESFKNKNFLILSVSFDSQSSDVNKFRDGKWKMPWLHAFSEGVFNNEATKLFEVSGIPKPLLIDPQGKIVAVGNKLRGESLSKTLAEFIK